MLVYDRRSEVTGRRWMLICGHVYQATWTYLASYMKAQEVSRELSRSERAFRGYYLAESNPRKVRAPC